MATRTHFLRHPLLPVLFLSLASFGTACAPVGPTGEATEAADSELNSGGTCRGIVAVNHTYGTANIGRELTESLALPFVNGPTATLPGVLRANYSESPYAYASTLELRGWSATATGDFEGKGSEMFVRVSGGANDANTRTFKIAKTLFDAMTRATETITPEAGTTRRRSAQGSITCERYTGVNTADSTQGLAYQCAFGPVNSLSPLESGCP